MKKTSLLIVLFCAVTSGFSQSYAEAKPVPYLFERFTKGEVLMKSGAVEPASLNYNADNQTISFENDGKIMTLTAIETVDTVYFSNKKFIPGADERFYEVITNSPVAGLYASYNGKFKPMTAVADKTGTEHEDASMASNTMSGVYLLRPYKGDFTVEIQKSYYLIKHKQIYKANSVKEFVKVFPHHDDEIAKYIADNQLKLKNEIDLSKLTDYCNTLK